MKKDVKDNKLLLLFAPLLLAVVAFLVFRLFITQQSSPYASEIAAAFVGTLLTISVTALLLKHETAYKTNAELDKEKSVKIYETKVETYQALMNEIERILLQESLEDNDRFRLQILFQKVVFVAGPDVLEKLPDFTQVFSKAALNGKISKAERGEILAGFGKLAIEIRADLNEQVQEDKEKLEKIITAISANFSPQTDEATFLSSCTPDEKDYYARALEYLKSAGISYERGQRGLPIKNKQEKTVMQFYPSDA